MQALTLRRLHELDILDRVSFSLVEDAIKKQSGLPVRVGFLKKGGDDSLAVKMSNY
jgi:hypothetical protein